MTDLAVAWNNRINEGDICVVGADLQREDGLDTAILVSLFSDARVREDELPPGQTWRRGWWGDSIEDEPTVTGSKLWLLRREKATEEVLVRARGYIREALRWMIQEGVAVAVNVNTFYTSAGRRWPSPFRWFSRTRRGRNTSSTRRWVKPDALRPPTYPDGAG